MSVKIIVVLLMNSKQFFANLFGTCDTIHFESCHDAWCQKMNHIMIIMMKLLTNKQKTDVNNAPLKHTHTPLDSNLRCFTSGILFRIICYVRIWSWIGWIWWHHWKFLGVIEDFSAEFGDFLLTFSIIVSCQMGISLLCTFWRTNFS